MNRRTLSRKWTLVTLAAIIVILACVRLGFWQLDRYHQRVDRNAATQAALDQPAVPLEELVAEGEPGAGETRWRAVTVSGHYDAEHQVLLRYRRLDGQSGVHVLTPLITEGGRALVVDRGFLEADAGAARTQLPEAPQPPAGDVHAVVRLRASEAGRGLGAAQDNRSIRYVNVAELDGQLRYPLYPQWAELIEQEPAAGDDLQLIPPPELSTGPSLLYAIQWWVFALIGVIGYVVLIRGEVRGQGRDRPSRGPNDQGPSAPGRAPPAHRGVPEAGTGSAGQTASVRRIGPNQVSG